jgi:hypothetical protein
VIRYILSYFLFATILYANSVYDISEKEYIEYKKNPSVMMEKFKQKFLGIKKISKTDKIKPKKHIASQKIPKTIIFEKPKVNQVIQTKVEKKELTQKDLLKFAKNFKDKFILNKTDKNISEKECLCSADLCDYLVKRNKDKYDTEEIKEVLNTIKSNKFNKFEAMTYFEQIVQIIKGE